jgi:exopolyphosphatase/guanosine-5'-triphosphate,3'-diphosphate pyrophosphatase
MSAFPALFEATVLDIGGGSTELIGGTRGLLSMHRSIDMGSVRYTERFLGEGPPSAEALAALDEEVSDQLSRLTLRRLPHKPLVGVAGTVTSVAALDLGLSEYDAGAIDGHVVTRDAVRELRGQLAELSNDAILALAPGILSGRADVFVAGVSILLGVLDYFDVDEVLTSDRGLRFGWALHLAEV